MHDACVAFADTYLMLLRQDPVQAADRADLREKLRVGGGGVVFTTIQKFMPAESGDRNAVLSDRRNIVVIADEARRSQYDFIDGFARHMRDALPQASFVGFTGTPIEKADANTRAVFGDYISIYDIQRAVEDGATVPIYYEGRLAKLELSEAERPKIDPDFEEVTEGEEVERKEGLKSKWAQLAAVVGSEKRLRLVAADLVDHFEKRLEVMDGKAMVVCMSRRICVELYREIVALRPEWAGEGDDAGAIKVVMTGSASDPLEWQGAHPEQVAARGAGATLPRPGGTVPDRHRSRHVADGLRRAQPPHHVHDHIHDHVSVGKDSTESRAAKLPLRALIFVLIDELVGADPGHHRAEPRADFLDRMRGRLRPQGFEGRLIDFVFKHPIAGEAA